MDIQQLVGTGGVPVVAAGTVLGVFELGERLASKSAKEALSKWLLTFDVRKAEALPSGTRALFDWIFGESHFSLKCFVRSTILSVVAMTLLGFWWLSHHPRYDILDLILDSAGRLWILWNILIDYVSLLKTRLILRALTRTRLGRGGAVAPLIVDFLAYMVLFALGSFVILYVYVLISHFSTLANPFTLPDWHRHLSLIIHTRSTQIGITQSSFGRASPRQSGCGFTFSRCL
jgi:hypothetical protein